MTTTSESPSAVFDAIVKGSPAEKIAAIRSIDESAPHVDRDYLRMQLVRALQTDFRMHSSDTKSNDTRCWLLSALGRVCGDDADAYAVVREHLHEAREPYAWARYWALEGLIVGKSPELPRLSETCAEDSDPLVSGLALVVLASNGDAAASVKVIDGLKEENPWHVLRGLRVVLPSDPAILESLRGMVANGHYDDATFDAICALAKVPPDSLHVDSVAATLETFIRDHRWSLWDGMRLNALVALGNLRVGRTAPLLIEELWDNSAAIVVAAAAALEKVLGIREATREIIDAAIRRGPSALPRLGNALRSMNRDAAVAQLEEVMLSGSEEQQDAARALLSEVGGAQAFQRLRARTTAVAQYVNVLEAAEARVRDLFADSINEAQRGFQIATRMDIAVFILGMLLILSSAMVLMMAGKDLTTWAGVGVTGGTGVLGVIYSLLIANPRKQVRESVDHLMHLKVVFLAYLRQLHQTDQAYTRRLLEDAVIAPEEVAKYSTMVATTMADAIGRLARSTPIPSKEAEPKADPKAKAEPAPAT